MTFICPVMRMCCVLGAPTQAEQVSDLARVPRVERSRIVLRDCRRPDTRPGALTNPEHQKTTDVGGKEMIWGVTKAPEPIVRWRIWRGHGRLAVFVGSIDAQDEVAAIRTAIQKFHITDLKHQMQLRAERWD
jgi:hypothetical protein